MARTCIDCGKEIQNRKAVRCRSCANRQRGGGPEARFWSRVDRSGGPDACWEFIEKDRIPQGYGRIFWNGRLQLAHRVSWELAHGEPLPDDVMGLHSCDNPPCCNPAHIHPGDGFQNMREAFERGRKAGIIGERNGRARLTPAEVREIRRRFATGAYSQEELAREYGLHQTQISRIVLRKAWAHVA